MLISYNDMPASIKALFPRCDKYPDFRCSVKTIREGKEFYYVKFNKETTKFGWNGSCWAAMKTW